MKAERKHVGEEGKREGEVKLNIYILRERERD